MRLVLLTLCLSLCVFVSCNHLQFANFLGPKFKWGSQVEQEWTNVTSFTLEIGLLKEKPLQINYLNSYCYANESTVSTSKKLPDIASVPISPTNTSSWIVPGLILIGKKPTPQDVDHLLSVGVNTFISLIGEYDSQKYKSEEYPASMANKHPISMESQQKTIEFIHYPVQVDTYKYS